MLDHLQAEPGSRIWLQDLVILELVFGPIPNIVGCYIWVVPKLVLAASEQIQGPTGPRIGSGLL